MKDKGKNKSSLLSKYIYLYEKNPRSRVFAPLAEVYRKLGMYDEGIQVLREGLKFHPDYLLAYIVLANIYYDKGMYDLAYSTVASFIPENLENVSLLTVYAQTCVELNKFDEALQTYKTLLLMNPKDEDLAFIVRRLEEKVSIFVEEEEEREPLFETSTEDWVQVNFTDDEEIVSDGEMSWSIEENETMLNKFKEEIKNNNIEVESKGLDSQFFIEEHDNDADDVITPEEDFGEGFTDQNRITSTGLVDLYLDQGHTEKAKDLLRELLEEKPDDMTLKQRLVSLDEANFVQEDKSEILAKHLDDFLEKIKSKAKEKNENTNY